jgi:hypothetical protein
LRTAIDSTLLGQAPGRPLADFVDRCHESFGIGRKSRAGRADPIGP